MGTRAARIPCLVPRFAHPHCGVASGTGMAYFPLMSLAEIKSAVEELTPAELAELAAFIHERGSAAPRQLSPRELGDLAAKLAGETDPAKAQILKEELTAGFYGGKPGAQGPPQQTAGRALCPFARAHPAARDSSTAACPVC